MRRTPGVAGGDRNLQGCDAAHHTTADTREGPARRGCSAAALSPLILLYVAQKNLLSAAGRRSSTGFYGWREAEHAARDRFTPRFAHRHDDAEVESWFSAAGYRDLRRVRNRPAPAVVPPHFLACTGVEGTRGG